jgi:hypothetical protein
MPKPYGEASLMVKLVIAAPPRKPARDAGK